MSDIDKHVMFLFSKAKNFREYIKTFHPSDEILIWLTSFNGKLLMPTILSILIPLHNSNQLLNLAIEVVKKLKLKDREDVVNKVCRYFEMFIEIVVSLKQ